MFAAVPSSALELELDPAHMIWLGIDYVQAVRDYGPRVYHVHAKDMEIRRDVLARVGIYGRVFGEPDPMGEHGWWRARIPGWGEVDWPALITALMEVGYHGNLDIEHEDQVFARGASIGPAEHEADIAAQYGREWEGLRMGYQTLSRLIPQ